MTTSDISAFFSRSINRCWVLVTDPYGFFEQVKTEPGMREAFWVFAVLSGFSMVMGLLVRRLIFTSSVIEYLMKASGVSFPFQFQAPEFGGQLVLALIGYAFGLLAVFVGAAILHAWAKIWGGNGNYADSFRLHIYRKIPILLLAWVPVLGAFMGIYSLVLTIIGVQKVHGISQRRAIVMFLLPYALLLIGVFVMTIFFGIFFAKMQAMQ